MPIDYLAADGETYSGPLAFTFLMQALENGEDAIEVLLVKSDSVVGDQDFTKLPGRTTIVQRLGAPCPGLLTVDPNDGGDPAAKLLEGIADQIL
jgi:hypothetical protein